FASLPALFNGPPSSIAPLFVDPNFKNANVQSWNLNVQQQITRSSALMVGYFGNKGTHLENDINVNQTRVFGVVTSGATNPNLPFQLLSPNSPILPNAPLAASVTERESGSNSNYNALWTSFTQHVTHGVQLNASYTYSHSIDETSRNNEGVVFQDSTNIFASRSNSDFDVRHRFIANAIYDLPFKGNRLTSGWQLAPIFTWQTGNPFTIVMNTSSQINGVANTVTPVQNGPIHVSGNPLGQWIANPDVFTAPLPGQLGNMRRNSVYGPGFTNLDFSVAKNTKLTERTNLQLRVDAFDVLNHPNYGQPGSSGGILAASLAPGPTSNPKANQFTSFTTIGSTRFPTGDSGSSRQIQLALKLQF
ncbi:MAG TPA: hypothetical protein VJ848_11320, partial [Candidatus Angelobacter sp.]|nr:hypothetical protein [Candidatus Angelobacter sp.]